MGWAEHGDAEGTDGGGSRALSDVGSREEGRILDEFVDITGLHRKHAMRLLRGQEDRRPGRRNRRRVYNEAEHNVLALLWEASDRICGKRLDA